MKNTPILALVVFTLLLAGCGKPSAPSNQQVLDYLNSRLPSGVPIQFQNPTLETFPEADGHCRVKYKATVHLNEDLLSPVSPHDALKSAGWDSMAYDDALAKAADIDEPFKSSLAASLPTTSLAALKLAQVASKAGAESPVYGTLEAERQADDTWTFSPIETSNITKDMPGQFAMSNAPGHFIAIDSDEAKKAIADEIDREKTFIAAVDAAKQQSDAARAVQTQQQAVAHAALVKQLLDATAPGKAYSGDVSNSRGTSEIMLVFTRQENGGKSLVAQLENPADTTQVKEMKGSLRPDAKDGKTIFLADAHTTGIKKDLPDGGLSYWLQNHGLGIVLTLTPEGNLSGSDSYEGQWKFDLKPVAAGSAPVTPPPPTNPRPAQ